MANVETKFRAAWEHAGTLPAPAAVSYRARLKRLYVLANGTDFVGAESGFEWDLQLANELDRIYAAVSDRADVVYENAATGIKRIVDGTADAAAKVGWGLWPVAIGAAVLLWAFADSKGYHSK